jgi:indole-3-glycerol phosphate synthase
VAEEGKYLPEFKTHDISTVRNSVHLKDFSVDISHSARLRQLTGEDTVFVSESGIRGPEDMKALYENGTDAVLIGEMLMRSPDRQAALKTLMQEVQGR